TPEPVRDERQGVLGVPRRLGEPVLEILEAFRVDPYVVTEHRGKPLLHDERSEHFGQRGRYGFEPRLEPAEVDVGVHGKPDARKQATLTEQVVPGNAHGLPEPQPGLDAPLLPRPPVMVDNALNPLLAHLALRAARQDQRVLHGNADLIVKAVCHPELQLVAGQLPAVHPLIEWMQVMVATLQHAAQPAHEVVCRTRRGGRAHSSNSMASSPTTIPAASTAARSDEPGLRIGFVLLICTYTVRPTPRLGRSSRLPAGPPMGR